VPPCPPGYYLKNGVCVRGPAPCPPGYHSVNGVCTRTIVKHVTTVETVIRDFVTNKPSYMLLLDTAQLCQLAGDTQCVAKQNQFDTLNLVTKLDSTGKTWTITGQVENRASKTQNNVQVIGYFYDTKGNSVGVKILRSNGFKKWCYMDPFCGSGLIKINKKYLFPGSPLVPLFHIDDFPFSKYYLSDIKQDYINALTKRTKTILQNKYADLQFSTSHSAPKTIVNSIHNRLWNFSIWIIFAAITANSLNTVGYI
jgi:hypothetical protein